jgi:hypothetical protein
MRNGLLKVGLNPPVGPLVLSRILAVLIKKLSSVERPLATLAFPVTSTASPMRGPQLLILVNSTDPLRYIFARIAKVPPTWMTLTSLLVIGYVLEDLVTSPIKAHFVLQVHLLLLISAHSVTRLTWVLWLIRHWASEIATESTE